MPNTEIDEILLIDRAKNGDAEAFRALVERSKMVVYRLAFSLTGDRHDAEDLSQDVFVKAYKSLSKFRGDSKWSTWLYRITVNTCMDHGRTKAAKGTEVEYEEHTVQGTAHAGAGGILPDRHADAGVLQGHIERALNTLSQQERAVFVLRHYHDLPLKQIASTLELAEGTVKSYLFRAIQQLQKELAFYRTDLGIGQSV